nr:hypothetical protein [Paraburkholderia panacisoli]
MRLDGLSGANPNGEAGVTADVNNHFFRIFGSTFLIAGVAAWIGHNQAQPTGTTININGVLPHEGMLPGCGANYRRERKTAYSPLHHRAERTAFQIAGAVGSLMRNRARLN